MNIEINIFTVLEKNLKYVLERKLSATLKSFLKTLQRLKQEWQKSPALGPGKQTTKTWFGLEIKKENYQIINAYLYLPFFLLIILWQPPIT
jgi:hypothetical protein